MRIVAALVLALVIEGAHANPPPVPQPFVATYEVTYRGLSAGTLTLTFRPDGPDGRYVYESRVGPSLLARFVVGADALERSIMEIGADGIRPLEWTLDDGKRGTARDGALKFDWSNGTVTGRVEDKPVELPIEPGVQDRLSIQIAVASALLRGEEPGEIRLIDDNRIKHYTYTKKDAVPLDTKLGKLETLLYESVRAKSDRVSRFWLSAHSEFLPVRVEQIRKGKVEGVIVMTEFKHVDATTAQ